MSDIEGFIREQITPSLRDGEQIRSMAYLKSASGGGVIGGLKAKAWFGALTDQRLVLIKTRVGAFKPLLENHGVQSIERADIAGVYVGGNRISIDAGTGKPIAFAKDLSTKRVPSQAALVEELQSSYGDSEAAKKLKRKQLWKTLLMVGIVLAVVGAGVYTRLQSRTKLRVECRAAPPNLECVLKHTQGDKTANACWNVVLSCQNGQRPFAQACAEVAPGSSTTKLLTVQEFKNFDKCDKVNRLDVKNLELSD